MKYILITGGVISGLGKGIIASSTGLYLKSLGYNVTAIKIDPYLNIDAGTMNPSQHGEVFVLDDGSESDLDLGNYERFMDIDLTSKNSITTGKVYKNVLEKERRGDYLGETIQVIPHITNEIQNLIIEASKINTCKQNSNVDVCIIELGGTVGDMESDPFIEGLRQLIFNNEKEDFINIHLGLLVHQGEFKTKPIQNSVKALKSRGILPDIVIARSKNEASSEIIKKISLLSGVKNIINIHDAENLYCVPEMLEKKLYFDYILKHFNFVNKNKNKMYDLCKTISLDINKINAYEPIYTIGIVGKYLGSPDPYLSIENSITHAKHYLNMQIRIKWIDSKTNKLERKLQECDGVIIPGGFGKDGIDGMINAAKYARVNKIPFLGICLGFQIALVEFARNVLNISDAVSEEILKSDNNVIIRMDDLDKNNLGGTMRLGKKQVFYNKKCKTMKFYENSNLIDDGVILERFRHRYEFNTEYTKQFEDKGINFVATDITGKRMSIFEYDNHKYYVGVQFHPEFKSRFYKPSPIFLSFLSSLMNI